MFTSKVIIKCNTLISVLLIGLSAVDSAQTRKHPAQPNEIFVSTSQDIMRWHQFDLGRRLGKSLSRDSAVFIGTIKAVRPQVVDSASPTSAGAPSITDVTVTMNEWLSGDNFTRRLEMQLERVDRPNSIRFRSDEGWSPWDGVELQVNNRLLVVYDTIGDDQAHSARLRLLISDENLFQSIRDAVILHVTLAKNPEDILRAPALLSNRQDFVLAGYVISYLSGGIRPNTVNTEALVLSKMLGSNHMPKAAWLPIRMTLTQLLLSEFYPVSQETRNSVTQALIMMGSATDVELAKQAVIILLELSDKKKLNMRPFLNDEQRKALNRIYLTAFSNDRAHHDFESQLGRTRPPESRQ